jgi:hypothetical protein
MFFDIYWSSSGGKSSENLKNKKKTPRSESASELYRPSDRRLSANTET